MIVTVACTAAAAHSVIVRTHLRARLIGDPGPVAPFPVDQVVCEGETMAVSLASGGTAGDIGFVLFRRTAAGWRVERVGGGYKLALFRAASDVQVVQPVYRKDDPNCCPTGGFDHVQYHWNGTRFAVARSWHTKHFTP